MHFFYKKVRVVLIFVVPSRAPTRLGRPTSKLQSHNCANNKSFSKKLQINLIFFRKILVYSKYLLYLCTKFLFHRLNGRTDST